MVDALAQRLGEALGLLPLPTWDREIPAAVAELCLQHGWTPDRFARQLEVDAALIQELAGLLTVGETYFFREGHHFDAVVQHLEERAASTPVLSVWSAGCATGEEPYSLAIAVARKAPRLSPLLRISASDISREFIERARHGVYRSWSFRSTPAWVATGFFDALPGPTWKISPEIRAQVELVTETIQARIERSASSSLDAIFFRNVSIYADAGALDRIYKGFSRILRPDGVLVVGAGDVPPPPSLFQAVRGEVPGLYTQAPPQLGDGRPTAPVALRAAPAVLRPREAAEGLATPARGAAAALAQTSGHQRTDAALSRQAATLADHGRHDAALEALRQALSTSPDDAALYLARGQIHLEMAAVDEAVVDLRRAIFLKPDDRITRYWFAVALGAAGLKRQASRQLQELERRLRDAGAEGLLEDARTSVAELRAAVDADLRALR